MNRPPDVELVLRDFFADDGSVARDHVLDIVEERIARQPQRLAWRLRGRPIVNTFTKLAAGMAAVLIVAFVAFRLIPGDGDVGGAATPVPTVTPTASPSPTPAPLTSGAQGPGTFKGDFAATSISWTVTLPDGWIGYATDIVNGPPRPGEKGVAILTERAVNVPKDSCKPQGTVPAATAEAFLEAVEARPDWDVSKRQSATLGAYPATRIDIVLPGDTTLCGTDQDYLVVAHTDGTGFHLQGPSMHVTYWVADVNGEPLVVERFSFAETPASDMAESEAVVGSIELST